MVTSTQKFNWLRQRLTGSKTEMPLVNKIIEFIMYESPIDIEKLRRSLHHQVSLHKVNFIIVQNSKKNIYTCQCLPFNELLLSNCLHQPINTFAHVTNVV